VLFSGWELIQGDFRFRRIIKAAFNTMRVNQVVRADRPSKLGKWRYPESSAFWTASSASSLFRRMALAIAKNFERVATTISSKASIPWVSDRVATELRGSELAELQALNRAFLSCVLKTGKLLWTAAAPVRPLKLADLDA